LAKHKRDLAGRHADSRPTDPRECSSPLEAPVLLEAEASGARWRLRWRLRRELNWAEVDAGVVWSPAPGAPLFAYARVPALPVSSEVKIECPMSNCC
jgi:hypothetical protein